MKKTTNKWKIYKKITDCDCRARIWLCFHDRPNCMRRLLKKNHRLFTKPFMCAWQWFVHWMVIRFSLLMKFWDWSRETTGLSKYVLLTVFQCINWSTCAAVKFYNKNTWNYWYLNLCLFLAFNWLLTDNLSQLLHKFIIFISQLYKFFVSVSQTEAPKRPWIVKFWRHSRFPINLAFSFIVKRKKCLLICTFVLNNRLLSDSEELYIHVKTIYSL
jgi:hypothetical protein